MPGYVECMVQGGRRAFIDVSLVGGVLTSPGMDAWAIADPERPLSILFRAGETLEVYGECVGVLLVKFCDVRQWLRDHPEKPIRVMFLDDAHND